MIATPVMDVDRPSIGLTQIQGVVRETFGDRVASRILYLNHEFARYMSAGQRPGGLDLHKLLLDNQHTALPEWFFRQAAFPEQEDNAEAYFRRYYPGRSPAVTAIKDALLERRAGLDAFLDGLVRDFGIGESTLVGLVSTFVQNVASFALARKLKAHDPNITIVMGGANCEAPMGQEIVRNVAAVDFVFSGPALKSFPEFLEHRLAGRSERCGSVQGVFSRDTIDRPREEQIGAELELDADVDLDYDEYFDSFDKHFSREDVRPMVLLETSRGCWWGERAHCTFCGLNGLTMAYRAMAADKAVALFERLFERYGDKSDFFFVVDNILPVEYLTDVFPRLNPPPGATLFYETKADITAEDLQVMARAGITKIQPGIESLATSTLKLMKKGTTSFVNLRLLKNCVHFGVEPGWNLLVGFPGELEEVYAKYTEDLPRLTHLWPPQGVAQIHFDRFSPYFNKAEEYGLKLKRLDSYPLIYPFPEESLEELAYYFMDDNFGADYMQVTARWLGKLQQRIQSWRSLWEGGERPQLELRSQGGKTRVFDSREGTGVEHELSDGALRLLEYLAEPRRLPDVQKFGEAQCFDGEAALAELERRTLVWNERGRSLSLVLGEPVGVTV